MTGEDFKRERKALGWTQQRVANLMGCAMRSVHRWEVGRVRVPRSVETIIALCKSKQEIRGAVDGLLNHLPAKDLDTIYAGRVFRALLEDDRNGI